MADPISWTTIAIMAATSAGMGAAQYALTPKPKRQRVDRGRNNDLRLTTIEEGVFLPIIKGWARIAPNIIWNTPWTEHEVPQSSGGGGKGIGGGQVTEPETTFIYKTSICCAIARGPAWKGLRRIWADGEVVYNLAGDQGGYYEAEDPANTHTGTLTPNTTELASGGVDLALDYLESLQYNTVLSHGAANRKVTARYRTAGATALSIEITTNGVAQTVSFSGTNGNFHEKTITLALVDGNNVIKFKNLSSGHVFGLDRIFCFPGFEDSDQVTGIKSEEDFTTVAPDADNPAPYFDDPPTFNPGGGGFGGGSASGTLNGLGGAQFFFYLGTEDQPQDATMVEKDGAENVPGYREVFYCFLKDITRNQPQLPHLMFEFDEGTHDLAVAVTDYYRDAGAKPAVLDMSELEGIHFIGHVIDQLRPLKETIRELEEFYNFDILDIDGKIRAVVRGGASMETITEDDLSAYEEGGEPPAGPLKIDYIAPHEMPRQALVSFLDVARDYYNRTIPVQRAVGKNLNPVELNYSIVAEADTALQVGLRELYRPYLERPVEFTTGPKFHRRSPTNPVTLVLSNITHRVRIKGKQAIPGGGLIKWKGVTENVGIYTQTLAPGGSGFEELPVDYPANCVFVIVDAPLLRPEDAGDGTSPVIYLAMCKRGTTRAWRGGAAFKEELEDQWERKSSFAVNSTIGQVRGTLGDCADPTVFDRSNSVTVDFWNEVTFASYQDAELLERPSVNLGWIGINGGQGEYIQIGTATPVEPLAGYKSAYTFEKFLRGRFGSTYAMDGHGEDEFFVLMNPNVKFRREDIAEIKVPRRWLGASIGQGINEAVAVSSLEFTLQGNSLKDPPPANAKSESDSAGSKVISFLRGARYGASLRDDAGAPLGEETESYILEVMQDENDTPFNPPFTTEVKPWMQMQAALVIHPSDAPGKFDHIDKNDFSVTGTDLILRAHAVQKILTAGNYIEATLKAGGDGAASLRFVDEAGINRYTISVSGGLASGIYIQVRTAPFEYIAPYNDNDEMRFRITLSGAEARFTQVYPSTSTPLLYVADIPPVFPLIPECIAATASSGGGGGTSQVKQMVLTCGPTPTTVLSARQLEYLFGSVPAEGETRIWIQQVSALVGKGHPLKVMI